VHDARRRIDALFILHTALLAISPAVLMVITAVVGAQARVWM
jgi:hypothetical protein